MECVCVCVGVLALDEEASNLSRNRQSEVCATAVSQQSLALSRLVSNVCVCLPIYVQYYCAAVLLCSYTYTSKVLHTRKVHSCVLHAPFLSFCFLLLRCAPQNSRCCCFYLSRQYFRTVLFSCCSVWSIFIRSDDWVIRVRFLGRQIICKILGMCE